MIQKQLSLRGSKSFSQKKFQVGNFQCRFRSILSIVLQQLRVAYQSVYGRLTVVVNLCILYLMLESVFTKEFRDSCVFAEEIIQFVAFAKLRSCVSPSQQVILS